MSSQMITSWQDLESLVQEYGFLPFFANEIPGFSVAEHTPRERWFSDTLDGPWEWKGDVALNGKVVYGKFFEKKAGFVSLSWFADFANYRRDGYDFDSLYEEGRVPEKDREIVELLNERHAMNTKEIKAVLDYRKGGRTGFETVITRLQMQTYVTVHNFVYPVDQHGNFYGWGIAQYMTPEDKYGKTKVRAAYKRDPQKSKARILKHLKSVLPYAEEEALLKIIG